jgi:chromosome segregation ATPase
MALRNPFGKDVNLDKLPAEIRPLVEQMRQERAAYEALLKRAEPLGAAVSQLEQRLTGLNKIAAQLAELQRGAATWQEGQKSTENRLVETKMMVEAARGQLETMQGQLKEVVAAKADLPGLLEMVKPLGAIRSEVGTLSGQLKDVAGRFDQVRVQHDKIVADSAAALKRLATLDADLQGAVARVEGFAARAQGLEGAVEQLQQLFKEVPDVKRELSTLNVLAEFVTRKVSTLESQKDMVERATQRAERLTELSAQVDRQLQEQHENTQFLERLEQSVDQIKKLHEAALQRADELGKSHRGIEVEAGKLEEDFGALREAVQKAVGQFTFERDGLETVSQRVVELREAVSALEKRLPAVDEARSSLEATASEAQRVADTVRDMTRQLQDLETSASVAQAAQAQVQKLQESVSDLTQRLQAVAPSRLSEELDRRAKQIEEARSRVGRLETKLADWGALEERIDQALQIANERRAVVETVRSDLQRLFEVADKTVAQVRAAAEQRQEIEQRAQSLDAVVEKLRVLDRQAEALEERRRQFAEAEERLSRLDASLIDLQSTFQAVLDQKAFLEQVVETAGSLALQTMQAEAAISTLREATEAAKARKP